ncbi:ATP-binding protein [Pantoea dispersa]|uniref:ATP-binding protein n=1 Tax=Pantoea dispersa TaxID=59814 RepID=UPI0021F7635C|nr:ATP-binding protein [Pantoea dispersa]UYP73495.1 ATP-binding protein [Pantoea dispersa]
MKFQIERIVSDGRIFELSQQNESIENTYTIITGRNSSGKSRLLTKVVNSFIFSRDENTRLSINSSEYPTKVIALSTGRFDKFPLYVHAAKSNEFKGNYFYYGLKTTSNSPHSTLTKGIASIFFGMKVNHGILTRLGKLFSYLDFAPVMDISFSLNVNLGKLKNKDYIGFYNDYVERNRFKDPLFIDKLNNYKERNGLTHLEDFIGEISQHIAHTQNHFLGKNFYLKLNLLRDGVSDETGIENLLVLIELNLLQVKDIRVYGKNDKNKISLFHTSSGQQCMILMMMGIASSISNGSLICIDEPEISLHPKWQLEFINLLQSTFSDYQGCHFLLATHSPQIVSGLNSHNGYILSLENNELTSSKENYFRSADYQLAEVFDAPGYRNEYVTKVAINLFAKAKKNKKIDTTDFTAMKKLIEFKKNISHEDPVYELIKTLEEVFDYYG